MVINGRPHGPGRGLAACQLPMRAFVDGATLTVEPLRARPFEVVEDLIADRGPVRRILEAGQIPSTAASAASIQSGFCIECGACVAACRNASASLLLGAKVLEHSRRPMPRKRVLDMVNAADEGGFGACSNDGVCEAICPKEVSLDVISALNRAFFAAAWRGPED